MCVDSGYDLGGFYILWGVVLFIGKIICMRLCGKNFQSYAISLGFIELGVPNRLHLCDSFRMSDGASLR